MQIKQAGTHVDMNPEACPHAPPPRLQIPPVWNDEAQISRMLVAQQAMIPSREPRPTLEPRLFTCGPWTAEPYVPRQRRSFISAPPEPDFKDPPPAAPRFILPSQPFPVRDRSDSDQSSAVSPTTRSHSREWDSTPTTACGSPYVVLYASFPPLTIDNGKTTDYGMPVDTASNRRCRSNEDRNRR